VLLWAVLFWAVLLWAVLFWAVLLTFRFILLLALAPFG
jgi:hypothetical protein